jgi:hypothetical protein
MKRWKYFTAFSIWGFELGDGGDWYTVSVSYEYLLWTSSAAQNNKGMGVKEKGLLIEQSMNTG